MADALAFVGHAKQVAVRFEHADGRGAKRARVPFAFDRQPMRSDDLIAHPPLLRAGVDDLDRHAEVVVLRIQAEGLVNLQVGFGNLRREGRLPDALVILGRLLLDLPVEFAQSQRRLTRLGFLEVVHTKRGDKRIVLDQLHLFLDGSAEIVRLLEAGEHQLGNAGPSIGQPDAKVRGFPLGHQFERLQRQPWLSFLFGLLFFGKLRFFLGFLLLRLGFFVFLGLRFGFELLLRFDLRLLGLGRRGREHALLEITPTRQEGGTQNDESDVIFGHSCKERQLRQAEVLVSFQEQGTGIRIETWPLIGR